MSDSNGHGPPQPVLIEYGRYKLWQQADGSPAIARATGICERCQECGCGEQQDLVTQQSVLRLIMKQGISMGGIVSGLKGVLSRGGNEPAGAGTEGS